MFVFKSNTPEIESELKDIIRLFTNEYDDVMHDVRFFVEGTELSVQIDTQSFSFQQEPIDAQNKLQFRKKFVRSCKNALYKALRVVFRRDISWGSLTGIRPTKLAYDAISEGVMQKDVPQILQERFFVSQKKAQLVSDIVQNQSGYFIADPSFVNLYVHIPFCPSRCRYCSFVTQSIDRQLKLVQPYVERLCDEIKASLAMLSRLNKRIYSVYIGGGTPTVLSDAQFEQVLEAISGYRGLCGTAAQTEYTCEAGRPETLSDAKVSLMQAYGVNRVSVNPQSLNPDTLQAIGRGHTVEDFFAAFERAKSAGFSVNVDLIAGLGAETLDDFVHTAQQIMSLRPHNVTVHTLSRKRGSAIKEQSDQIFASGVSLMTDFAEKSFREAGYLPYYLYRQKLMLENLENVGYSLAGFQCVNNITVMEESLSVVACGAGAISKRVIPSVNRIERYANIKDIALYLERFFERQKQKEVFFASKLC